jgi:hypothetical protein
MYDYHRVDTLHRRYRVTRPPVLSVDAAARRAVTWTCEFTPTGKAPCTLIVTQGAAVPAGDEDDTGGKAPTFDALVDLRAAQKQRTGRIDDSFSALALAIAEVRGADQGGSDVRVMKKWLDTNSLLSAVTAKISQRARTATNPIIDPVTRLLEIVLDAAVASRRPTVRVLCVCDVGRERSLLFLGAWLTIADLMRQHADLVPDALGASLDEAALARIAAVYRSEDSALRAQMRLLMARSTPSFIPLFLNFPTFYLSAGLARQGGKRAHDPGAGADADADADDHSL